MGFAGLGVWGLGVDLGLGQGYDLERRAGLI